MSWLEIIGAIAIWIVVTIGLILGAIVLIDRRTHGMEGLAYAIYAAIGIAIVSGVTGIGYVGFVIGSAL